MKKLLIISVVVLAACNSKKDDAKTDSMKSGSDTTMQANVTYDYPVTFSKFEIGDAKNAKMLTELWKDFDNGDLSVHKGYFADQVEMLLANSAPMIGASDTIIKNVQNYRNTIASVKSTVDAIVPLHNLDSNYNYVAIWGKEVDTWKNGKTDSSYLQEVWRFNKDNKVDWMVQYVSKPPAMPEAKKK